MDASQDVDPMATDESALADEHTVVKYADEMRVDALQLVYLLHIKTLELETRSAKLSPRGFADE